MVNALQESYRSPLTPNAIIILRLHGAFCGITMPINAHALVDVYIRQKPV